MFLVFIVFLLMIVIIFSIITCQNNLGAFLSKNAKHVIITLFSSTIVIFLISTSITSASAYTSGIKHVASKIEPGTVLCQPHARDWPQTNDWQTVDDEYVNRNGNSTPIIALCNIPVRDYSVEAKMRTVDANSGFMGVFARLNLEKSIGYKGGIDAYFDDGEVYDLLNSLEGSVSLGSFDTDTVYSIKMQVIGTSVALYINNKLLIKKHYTSANNPGTVGIECDKTCELLQFTVVAQ